MTLLRGRMAAVVLVFAAGAIGCGKAKSALEDAAGFAALADADIAGIKSDVQWSDTDPLYANLSILGGFSLKDNFAGDLNQKTNIGPVPFSVPDQAAGQAADIKSLALAKVITIAIDDKTSYKRLQIISVARFDPADSMIKIDGDIVNQYLDPDQVVSKAANNQAGSYVLIQGKGNKGLQFLNGTLKLQRDGQAATAAEATKNAWVFTTGSPFVTKTGGKGMYFLAVLKGSKGSVIAYKGNIGTVGSENPATPAPGTPTSAQKDVSYAGVLDVYKGAFDSKVTALNNSAVTTKADDFFTTVNTKVTDFVNGWKIVTTDLMFIQPKQTPPAAPTPPPAAASTDPTPVVKVDPPKTAADPAPKGVPVMRRDLNDTDPAAANYNVDLGCSGYNGTTKLDLVRDGAYFDDYAKYPGWRARGDVRYSTDYAAVIFPTPSSSNYLDGSQVGYCVLTTGDQMYQLSGGDTSGNAAFKPQDGMVSEMWQKVKVPSAAKSIQLRVAFFSTEFPKFVGSQYNDSFTVKFDESPAVLATGNLNDLGGANSSKATDDQKRAIANCSTYTYAANKGQTCGDWMFVADSAKVGDVQLNGELWGIDASKQAPKNGDKMGCMAPNTKSTNNRCYAGMIPARIICKDLADADKGQLRTLRISVSDAGDSFFDSALAVDSVAFSTSACDDAAGRISTEANSRAAEL